MTARRMGKEGVRLSVVAALAGLLATPTAGAGGAASAAPSCPSRAPSQAWTSTTVSRGSRQFGPVTLAVAPSGATVVAWGPDGEFAQRRPSGRFTRPRPTGGSAIDGLHAAVIDGHIVIATQARDAIRLSRVSGDGRSHRIASVTADRLNPFVLAAGAPGLLAWTLDGRAIVARVDSDGLDGVESLAQPSPIAAATSAGPRPGALLAFASPSPTGLGLDILERDAGRAWGAPVTVPTSGFPSTVSAVRSVFGGAGVIWQATAGSASTRFVVESVARRPGGPFGRVQRLSASKVTSPPAVASTPRGRAFAVWTENRGDISELMLAEHVPGGDWGPRVRLLFHRRPLHEPAIAVSADGRRLVVVAAVACGKRVALLSRQRLGHRWRPPEVIATWAGYAPRGVRAGIDADGHVLVAWPQRPRSGGGIKRIPVVVATRRASGRAP